MNRFARTLRARVPSSHPRSTKEQRASCGRTAAQSVGVESTSRIASSDENPGDVTRVAGIRNYMV
jgi:hypothetical protein